MSALVDFGIGALGACSPGLRRIERVLGRRRARVAGCRSPEVLDPFYPKCVSAEPFLHQTRSQNDPSRHRPRAPLGLRSTTPPNGGVGDIRRPSSCELLPGRNSHVPRLRHRHTSSPVFHQRVLVPQRPILSGREGTRPFPNEPAALKCLYSVTRSLDPTGKAQTSWIMRRKSARKAFTITFADRWPLSAAY